MKNTITLNIDSKTLPVTPDKIASTSWEAVVFPNYNVEDYVIDRALTSSADKESWDLEYDPDTLLSEYLYYRYKVHYIDNNDSGWIMRKIAVKSTSVDSSIIKVPDVNVWYEHTEDDEGVVKGVLKVQSSEFRDFGERSTHNKTSYEIFNSEDHSIYKKEAIVGQDGRDVKEIDVPLDLFQDGAGYTVNVTHQNNNGINGGTRSVKFESFPKDEYFELKPMGDLISNQFLYFNLTPKTLNFKSVDISIRDLDGNLRAETLNQDTIFPLLRVPVLDVGSGYKVFASANLEDGTKTTAELIVTQMAKGYDVYPHNTEKTYLDTYSNLGNVINPGYSTQCLLETRDNHVLIASKSDRCVNMYKIEDEALKFVSKAFDIPMSDKVSLLYINMVERYDGRFVVNYASNTNDPNNQESVFALYDYNPTNKKFILANEVRKSKHFEATAITNSMVVAENNDVYFIPNRIYVDKQDQQLKLFKLTGNTFQITEVLDLPFVANRYVNIVPTKVDNEFLIFGGSKQRYKDAERVFYKRDNNEIWKFNASNALIEKTDMVLDTLPVELHAISAHFKRDGKILIFNNVEIGEEFEDQSTYTLDPETGLIEHHNNDLPGAVKYRTTVELRNGDFIRINTNTKSVHTARRYVSDSLESIHIITNEGDRETELVVGKGKVKTIEDPRLYEKIDILGESDEDTGILHVIKDGIHKTYDYQTLLVPHNRTITSEENANYTTKVVFDGASLTIT